MEIMKTCTPFQLCRSVKDIFTDSEEISACDLFTQTPGISKITDNLLLCAAVDVKPDILRKLDVTCVVNAAIELPDTPLPAEDTLYRRIAVHDSRQSDISANFDEVADLIEKVANEGGRTLVHCMAGISRSATLCIAYLMKHKQMCLRKAILHVRQRRSQIMPNPGFFHQLIEYENRLFGHTSVKMVFNELFHMEMPDIYDKFYRKHTKRYMREIF